jgi:DNA-directed RNA polymerase specialized sigma24 family protein
MSVSGGSHVSAVLLAAQAGNRQAATDLLPLVYAELHERARARLARQPSGQTLTPTALVLEALQELEARDPLKAQIVLLRYFTGLTMDETAAVLGLAQRTLDRHWRYIRAWLMKPLR